MKRQLSTSLLAALFFLSALSARAQESGPRWTPLFNGKDLTGWHTDPKQPGHWRVEHGAIVGSGNTLSHLFSERGDFDSFHLRVEARINATGNSGVFFRSEYGLSRQGYPAGYEAQIYAGGGREDQLTGSLYGFAPVRERLIQPNQWFTLEVTGDGRFIDIKVNGKTAVHFKDEKNTYRKGHFALQQFPGTTVAFRRIDVQEPAPAMLGAKVRPKPWAVILCKFSDLSKYEPYPARFYKEAFTEAGAGKGREFDYFRQVSYGHIDMTGSKVFGWFTMPKHSTKDLATLKYPLPGRVTLHEWGVELAKANGVDLTPFYGVLVIFNSQTDAGSAERHHRVVLGYKATGWDPTFNCHEMGHGFDLNHSWFARPDTEYGDRWDLMSSARAYMFKNSFGLNGPGLNAYQLRSLGCIPPDRIWTSQGKAGAQTITLAALNQFDARGYLMASIPPAPGSNSKTSYLVEFRRKTGWDAAIPQDTILVHEDRDNGRSYLLSRKNPGNDRDAASIQVLAGQEFSIAERNLTIKAVSFDTAKSTAKVTITIAK